MASPAVFLAGAWSAGRHNCIPGILIVVAAAGFASALAFSALVFKRVLRPLNDMTDAARRFFNAGYRLDAVIPRAGRPELRDLAGSLNRMMLELQSYRAFQISQIMEEKNKAQALIDTISDGVILVDELGGIIYSNQAALALLGIPRVSPEVVLPAAIKNEVFAREFAAILASGEKFLRSEAEIKLPAAPEDGEPTVRNYGIMASRFFLATLKRQGRVVILRDITNEKELEKTKEAFFHMITHDMRSPLATIQGYAEILRRKLPQSPETEKYFKSMVYSSRRLRGMIDDILNTTDLQRGVMAMTLEKVCANALIARVAEQHEPVTTPKKITVSIQPLPQELEFIADAALMERVLTNLVLNALRSTPAGGTITLGVSQDAENVLFWVGDTGPAMPDDKRGTIFEQYSRMEKQSGQSMGLGLAMCKMMVELHKGRIWVESEAGKGSKFLFTISKSLKASSASQAKTLD